MYAVSVKRRQITWSAMRAVAEIRKRKKSREVTTSTPSLHTTFGMHACLAAWRTPSVSAWCNQKSAFSTDLQQCINSSELYIQTLLVSDM